MMSLGKVFEILCIGSSYEVVFLLGVLGQFAIIETIRGLRVIVGVLSTCGVFTGKIEMEVKVFKTVNLIVGLDVT